LRTNAASRTLERGLAALVCSGVLILAGVAGVARQQTLRLDRTAQWADNARATVAAIEALSIALLDGESAQRGTLLGLASGPQRTQAAVLEARASLARLEHGLDDDPQQRAHLARLRTAVDARLGALARTDAAARALALDPSVDAWRETIRAESAAMVERESRSFDARVAASRADRRTTMVLAGAALLAMFALAIAAAVLFARQLRLRAEMTAQLLASRGHLRQNQRQLKTITDNLPVTIVRLDLEQRCTYANEHVRRLFGHDPAALVGQSHREWLGEREWARIEEHVHAALRGEVRELEVGTHIQGQPAWMQQSLIPDIDADGRVVGYLCVNVDITERKRQEEALRKSELLLDRTSTMAGIGGWEYDLRREQLAWSEQMRRIHGVGEDYRPDMEQTIAFFAPQARETMRDALRAAFVDGTPWDLELPFVQAGGQAIWVRSVGSAEFADGAPVRLVGALQDISELRQLAADLAEDRLLLRVTLESIGDAVITTDARGAITWLNPVAERLTGWQSDEAIARPLVEVFDVVDEATREPAPDPVARCLAQQPGLDNAGPRVLLSRLGVEYGIQDTAAPIRGVTGEVLGVVLVFHDVSEQRRLSTEMSWRATHDTLTGLVNRPEFEARLHALLEKSRNDGGEHALLYIDLDQFKLVNDVCGHAIGDQLLQQVARLLGDSVRSRDTLARLGGDEFGILMEHCSAEHAQRVAQKICDRMDDFRFVHEERRFRIGASIGLVPVDRRWQTTAAIQQAADTSCYAAKEAGRNRVHAWFETDVAMRERQFEMQWTTRIEQALDEDGFVLFAQRIVPLKGPGTGVHAEVLLRMALPGGALAGPGAFLPAAERFHLASRIDRWVLRHAVDWMAALPEPGRIELLSVNLSGQSVGDRSFHRWALELLDRAGPRLCGALCLEITETAAVTHIADAAAFVDAVRTRGVKVALDDFGAGAASFGYLKTLRVDILKIDGQFVRDLVDDPLDEAAVRCFADVARVTGLATVAEFVDKPEVLERLRAMDVDFAQGYLLHLPEPIAQLLEPAPAAA
jgi:diguanylate cyclase (GGDEF)-like protein/PAS domain S-box-containing protein